MVHLCNKVHINPAGHKKMSDRGICTISELMRIGEQLEHELAEFTSLTNFNKRNWEGIWEHTMRDLLTFVKWREMNPIANIIAELDRDVIYKKFDNEMRHICNEVGMSPWMQNKMIVYDILTVEDLMQKRELLEEELQQWRSMSVPRRNRAIWNGFREDTMKKLLGVIKWTERNQSANIIDEFRGEDIKSDDSDDETNHLPTMKRRLSGNEKKG
jgi:hypothetical protein